MAMCSLQMFTDRGLGLQSSVPITGGGGYKYRDQLARTFKSPINRYDELVCLLTGLNFMLQTVPNECFYIRNPGMPKQSERVPVEMRGVFPYVLVNIGSGVSFLRVDSEMKPTSEGLVKLRKELE